MSHSAHKHQQSSAALLLVAASLVLGVSLNVPAPAFAQSADPEIESRFNAAYNAYREANTAGNIDRAITSAREALELGRVLFDENSQNTANLYLNHADLVVIQGEKALAEQEYLSVISIYDALYGEKSLEHVPVFLRLGELSYNEENIAYLQDALDSQRTAAPEDLLAYIDVVIRVSRQLHKTSRSENGYGLLLPVIDLLEEAYGEDSPHLVGPLMAIGIFEPDNVRAKRYQRAIKILEDAYPEDNVAMASYSLNAGQDLLAARAPKEAKRFLRDAHDVFSEEFGVNHELTAVATLALGELELMEDKQQRAEDYILQSLRFFAGQIAYQPEEIRARSLLVDLYEQADRSDDATPHLLALSDILVFTDKQEFMPLVKSPPEYPRGDVIMGREGWVLVEYTVDEFGRTKDAIVVDSDASPKMQEAARVSVQHYRYVPRAIDGEPVAVTGVRTRISFVL